LPATGRLAKFALDKTCANCLPGADTASATAAAAAEAPKQTAHEVAAEVNMSVERVRRQTGKRVSPQTAAATHKSVRSKNRA